MAAVAAMDMNGSSSNWRRCAQRTRTERRQHLDQLKHNQRRRHASQEIRGSAWDPEQGGEESAKFIAAIKLPHLPSPRLGVYQDQQRPPRDSLLATFKARRDVLWQEPDPAVVEQPPKSARPPRKSPRAIKALPQLGLSAGEASIDSMDPLKSYHEEDLGSTTLDPGSTSAETSYLNTTTLHEEPSQFSIGGTDVSKKLLEEQLSLASMPEPPEPAPEPAVEEEADPQCRSLPWEHPSKQISPPSTVYEVSSSGASEARSNDMKEQVASDVLAVITHDAMDFVASSNQGEAMTRDDPAPAMNMAGREAAASDEPTFKATASEQAFCAEEEFLFQSQEVLGEKWEGDHDQLPLQDEEQSYQDVGDREHDVRGVQSDELQTDIGAGPVFEDSVAQEEQEADAVPALADEALPLAEDGEIPLEAMEGYYGEERQTVPEAVPPTEKDATEVSEDSLPVLLAEVLEADEQLPKLLALTFPPLDLSFDFLLKLEKDWAEELPDLVVDDPLEEGTERKPEWTRAPDESKAHLTTAFDEVVAVPVEEAQASSGLEPRPHMEAVATGDEVATDSHDILPKLGWQPWEDSTASLALSEPPSAREVKQLQPDRRTGAEDEVPRVARLPSKQERFPSSADGRLPTKQEQEPDLAYMPAASDSPVALVG